MFSWLFGLLMAIPFVFVGGEARFWIERVWPASKVLITWQARLLLNAAAILTLGLATVRGDLLMGPLYGLALGFVNHPPRKSFLRPDLVSTCRKGS